MVVVYPDEIQSASDPVSAMLGRNTAAVKAMMKANGIAPDAKPVSTRKTSQLRMAHLEMDRIGPDAKGEMRHIQLNANAAGRHNDVKLVFLTPSGKPAVVDVFSNHKKGALKFSNKKIPESSPLCTSSSLCMPGSLCALCAPSSFSSAPSSVPAPINFSALTGTGAEPTPAPSIVPSIFRALTGAGAEATPAPSVVPSIFRTLTGAGAEATPAPSVVPSIFRALTGGAAPVSAPADADADECAFPHAEGLAPPETAEDLAHLLAELKPAKHIVDVAVDIEIKRTFVTELVVETKKPEPEQRHPILVVICKKGVPSQSRIRANPRLMAIWRIGPGDGKRKQVLVLRCTRKIDIHVHFQAQVEVPDESKAKLGFQ
ncbi:hypothetical protein JCM3770_001864 [Rhodotorula araucariae]